MFNAVKVLLQDYHLLWTSGSNFWNEVALNLKVGSNFKVKFAIDWNSFESILVHYKTWFRVSKMHFKVEFSSFLLKVLKSHLKKYVLKKGVLYIFLKCAKKQSTKGSKMQMAFPKVLLYSKVSNNRVCIILWICNNFAFFNILTLRTFASFRCFLQYLQLFAIFATFRKFCFLFQNL